MSKRTLTPSELGELYTIGLWGVAATKSAEVTDDNLLLRAITLADWQTGTDGSSIKVDKATIDILENAVAFEVIDQGPLVKTDRKGLHCLHLASSADALNPDGTGEFVIVREKDVVMFWDASEALTRVRALMAAMIEQKESEEARSRIMADNSIAKSGLVGV